MAQLSSDKMVVIPILDDPRVRNSGLNHTAGSRPICREDWLPYDKDTDRQCRRLVQQFFDCGRPPQAGRSGRRHQQHQPGFVARAIEIVLKVVEVASCQ